MSMNMPTIDRSECLEDGCCARVCPSGHLVAEPGDVPRSVEAASCIECGHCVAVCPTGAITLGEDHAEDLAPLRPGWRLDAARSEQLLRGRRSTRAYREEPLPREAIAGLLATAQYAPSGHNSQPIHWTVIQDRVGVQAVAAATAAWVRRMVDSGSPAASALGLPGLLAQWDEGRDVLCRGAPHLVVAHAPASDKGGTIAGAIAITYLDLAAVSVGAGTCWAGYVFIAAGLSPEVAQALGVPEGRRCCGVSLLGRPAEEHLRIPNRRAPTVAWI
jgi:nitroreductase/NAD-dependent dihydropyrimidine dehydrogenase PreA subunit